MPPPKDYIKILYPRKCEHCNHIANSQPAYFYHAKKHQPIPTSQLCEYGCGQPACVVTSHGKYICNKTFQKCPAYGKKISSVVTNHWKDNVTRKTNIKNLNFKKAEEKSKNFIPSGLTDYEKYAKRARYHARKWATQAGHKLGRKTYHVDHKFSIMDAWNAGLAVEIVNNPANLQILEAKKNSSKGMKSSITLEELMNLLTPSVELK